MMASTSIKPPRLHMIPDDRSDVLVKVLPNLRPNPSLPAEAIWINFNVRKVYYSSDRLTKLSKEIGYHSSSFLPESFISPHELVAKMLTDADIPFPLEKLRWTAIPDRTETKLESREDLISHIVEEIRRRLTESTDVEGRTQVDLYIDRRAICSRRELEARIDAKEKNERLKMLTQYVSYQVRRYTTPSSFFDIRMAIEYAVRDTRPDKSKLDPSYERKLLRMLINQAKREVRDAGAAVRVDDPIRMTPASASVIEGLKKLSMDGENSTESCSICRERISVGATVTCLPCSHEYHTDCIMPWLERSHVCPLCRYQLPTEFPP